MTQTHPTGPPTQPWGTPPPAPPKRPFYRQTWFIVTAVCAALMLLGLLLLAALIGAVGEGLEQAASPAQDSIKEQPKPAPSTVSEALEPQYVTPEVSDFHLKVVETGREHFGSIGDNVEYRLELEKTSNVVLDPDKEYELKYRVTGSEDGPMTDTLIIRGDSYEEPYEQVASTRRNVKMSAKVLSITEV